MRSPKDMDILQIDASNRCFLRCSNCTRAVAHQAKPQDMTLGAFGVACQSLRDWLTPGKVVGMMGGEVTLHPDFGNLCCIMRDVFEREPLQQGHEPIADFNAFVQQRLFDRSNGLGLWTSLGQGFYRHYEEIMRTFSNWTVNDHQHEGRHQSLFIDRKEFCRIYGITDDEWVRNRDNCWVQNTWSASVTWNGAYFCEVAGTIDNLYYGGKHAWPVTKDWWKREPHDFKDQIHLCNHCALAQPGPSTIAGNDKDVLCAVSVDRLRAAGSPAVLREKYVPAANVYSSASAPLDNRTDRYIDQAPRVSSDNKSIRPRKLTAIVTCVGREEHLKQTWAHNRGVVDELVVVGTSKAEWDDEVAWVSSLAHLKGEAAFNKGALLNDALASLLSPDWIVFTDADCFLPEGLKDWVHSHSLNPSCLYGARREGDDGAGGTVNSEPNGFFQMFRWDCSAFKDKWPRIMSEAFCSAGGVDSWFMQQFPKENRIMIPELTVRHIEHAAEIGADWNGPVRDNTWRQLGWINPAGEWHCFSLEAFRLMRIKARFKLTDTLRGESVEIDRFGDEVTMVDGQLHFLGKPTHGCHIHVAYMPVAARRGGARIAEHIWHDETGSARPQHFDSQSMEMEPGHGR